MTDHARARCRLTGFVEHASVAAASKEAHHHLPGLKATIVKVVLFTGMSVIITSIVLFSLLDIEVHPTAGYYADFTDVSGLQAGDTVRVAGVEVGKVGGVSVHGDVARVSFSLETSQHVTTTTRASIHFANLLGELYLDILPGAPGGTPLKPGGVIPVSQTTPPLDLTAVFDGFQPLFSALSPSRGQSARRVDHRYLPG